MKDVWCTDREFLTIGSGDWEEHAVLLANYFKVRLPDSPPTFWPGSCLCLLRAGCSTCCSICLNVCRVLAQWDERENKNQHWRTFVALGDGCVSCCVLVPPSASLGHSLCGVVCANSNPEGQTAYVIRILRVSPFAVTASMCNDLTWCSVLCFVLQQESQIQSVIAYNPVTGEAYNVFDDVETCPLVRIRA